MTKLQKRASVAAEPALQRFKQLSPQVYYLPPAPKESPPPTSYTEVTYISLGSADDSTTSDAPPELILLFTWMGAAPKHIAKYTATYQLLYPQSAILLIRTGFTDVAFRPYCNLWRRLTPAVTKTLSTITTAASQGRKPRILVHAFSNGGSFTFLTFAKLFRQRAGTTIPLLALILDSGPGRSDYARSINAIMAGVPQHPLVRLPARGAVHVMLTAMWALNKVLGAESIVQQSYREMNDGGIFDMDTPRLYLYSKSDEMVNWRHVEAHAEIARKKGDVRVECVRFEKSGHVNHVREDGEKYWDAVRRCWEARNDA
jgi:Eukaryotic protein of unknown function (DUF829)